jgi:hypothetical protein
VSRMIHEVYWSQWQGHIYTQWKGNVTSTKTNLNLLTSRVFSLYSLRPMPFNHSSKTPEQSGVLLVWIRKGYWYVVYCHQVSTRHLSCDAS